MTCEPCPLEAMCQVHRELDKIEDELSVTEINTAIGYMERDDNTFQPKFDRILWRANTSEEVQVIIPLVEGTQRVVDSLIDNTRVEGLNLIQNHAKSRDRIEEREREICLGVSTRRKYIVFGKVATRCGSLPRRKRLGETSS